MQPPLGTGDSQFGPPSTLMRDLGPAIISAGEELARSLQEELGVTLNVLGCHLHFLKDIGKDILQQSYDEVKKGIGTGRLKSRLRELIRDIGRRLGTNVDKIRQDVSNWLKDTTHHDHLPSGLSGLALVRAMAQWVLDYAQDGKNHGFPFDRPYLDLYHRCLTVHSAAIACLETQPIEDAKTGRAFRKLDGILRAVTDSEPIATAATTLERLATLFEELRKTLRIHPPKHEEAQKTKTAATERDIGELNDVRLALDAFSRSLQARRSLQGQDGALTKGIDIILAHFERHKSSLWGHVVELPDSTGRGRRLVDRTNNVLEAFFHMMKHAERRRSGRKILTQDFERLPAAAALAYNLTRADYVEIVCDSLDKLPKAFASLDIARATKLHASTTPEKAPTGENTQTATASMPRGDRPLIRAKEMRAFLEAAARRPRAGAQARSA